MFVNIVIYKKQWLPKEVLLALSSHSAYALVFTKLLSGLPASFLNAWDLSLVC